MPEGQPQQGTPAAPPPPPAAAPAAQAAAGAPPPAAAAAPPPPADQKPPPAAAAGDEKKPELEKKGDEAGKPAAAQTAPIDKQPPAQEQKPEGDKKPPPQAKPPEFELKLPEGQYDPAAIGEFKQIMADEKLTPAQKAQAVIDLNQKSAQEAQKAFNARVKETREKDVAALRADKDFGGERYDATVKEAGSAMQQFFGEDGSKLLKSAGLDNHPALVKGLARIRQLIAEDDTGSRVPNAGKASDAPVKPRSQTQRGAGIYSDPKVKRQGTK